MLLIKKYSYFKTKKICIYIFQAVLLRGEARNRYAALVSHPGRVRERPRAREGGARFLVVLLEPSRQRAGADAAGRATIFLSHTQNLKSICD